MSSSSLPPFTLAATTPRLPPPVDFARRRRHLMTSGLFWNSNQPQWAIVKEIKTLSGALASFTVYKHISYSQSTMPLLFILTCFYDLRLKPRFVLWVHITEHFYSTKVLTVSKKPDSTTKHTLLLSMYTVYQLIISPTIFMLRLTELNKQRNYMTLWTTQINTVSIHK